MITTLRRWILRLVAALCVMSLVFGAGYLARQFEVQPLHGLVRKVENRLNRAAGGPSETEQRLSVIETTFVRLRGTVHPMPENDWVNGGALAVWNEDLLAIHSSGRILLLEDGVGLRDLPIAVPDNGRAAYTALAGQAEWAEYTHKPDKMRYNDLVHVQDGGLSGLALSYTFFDAERTCYGTRVAWLPVDVARAADLTAAPEDWQILFETTPCLELNPGWTALDGQMAGGRMAYRGGGKLILGSGEYHLDGVHTYDVGIQSDETDYGKVIEIDLQGGAARHVSKGHRNMQGVAVDGQNRIWVTEHAVRGGDELNLVEEGGNYGWPLETLGTLYSGQPFPSAGEAGRHVLHTPPVYAWLPSAAVSALTVIDGFHPTWDGDLLTGSLSSEAFGQSLFRLRIRDGRALFVERIELGRRVRYVTQFNDRIAVWLDSNELVLFSIEPRLDPLADTLAALKERHPPELAARIERMLGSCGECHSYVQASHDGAPSLNGVLGRTIGGTGFEGYSEALAGQDRAWDADTLRAYLLDPQATFPGTSMPAPGVADDAALTGLIEALGLIDTTQGVHLKYN